MNLAIVTLALLALPALPAGADLLLDDFEQDPERWGPGLTLSTEHVMEGESSLRWPAERVGRISLTDFPHDWSEYRAVRFWMYSEQATDSRLIFTFVSMNPETEGGDYFVHFDTVNWVGWREFELVLEDLGRARSPMGLHQIERLDFYARGWGQEELFPGTVLYLDDLRLVRLTREMEELQRKRRQGYTSRMSDTEDLLEYLARGGDGLDNWRPLERNTVPEGEGGLRQEWSGATLWAQAPGTLAYGRDYDLDVSEHTSLLILLQVASGTEVAVRLTVDGETTEAAVTPADRSLEMPLEGERLRRLEVELGGEGDDQGRREATLHALALRRPERPTLSAFSNHTRGVLLAWERPSWGAPAYRLYRSRAPITAENLNAGDVVSRDVSADLLRAADFPPAPGEWHYAVAPLHNDMPGPRGPAMAVSVGEDEAPRIPPADGPITIDGNLDDWPAGASPITISPEQVVMGEPPASPADLSAQVRLCHCPEALYVGATITDDVIRHDNPWTWEGDGLVVLLRFDPGTSLHRPQRYDLVLNYTAGTPGGAQPRGVILEDRTAAYPPDDKPPAPGEWAVAYHDGRYVLEAAIPLETLREYGFNPQVGGLALGLTVFDADQPDGPTARERAISWNQREALYDPAEAAVVVWEDPVVRQDRRQD